MHEETEQTIYFVSSSPISGVFGHLALWLLAYMHAQWKYSYAKREHFFPFQNSAGVNTHTRNESIKRETLSFHISFFSLRSSFAVLAGAVRSICRSSCLHKTGFAFFSDDDDDNERRRHLFVRAAFAIC